MSRKAKSKTRSKKTPHAQVAKSPSDRYYRGMVNLAKIIKKEHEKNWVALSKDQKKVVGFDKSLVALRNLIGDQKVIYMKVPPGEAYLSF